MASTDPKAVGQKAPAAGQKSGGIDAPKIELGAEFERVATGADGFWRCDEGDEVFGEILGTSEKLETVLVELLQPAIAHKGVKGVKPENREYFLAPKGAVLHLNLHYNVMPVLMNAPVGTPLYIKCGEEVDIGGGKSLKNFDVRMPKEIKALVPGIGAAVKARASIADLKRAQAPQIAEQATPPSVQS